jgi:hypothetical protein
MKLIKNNLIKEISKYCQFIRHKLILRVGFKKYPLFIVIILGAILLNYLFSIKIYGGKEFFINWASARQLLFQGINPYSQEATKQLSVLSKELLILPNDGNYQFISPLYSLFLYIPFGLIQNFDLARAVWMTIMELVSLFSCFLIINIFNWNIENKIRNIFYAFSLTFFYTLLILLIGSNLIILNLFFILGIKWVLEEKYINAGIIFALLTISFQIFIIPLIVIFIYSINKRAWNVIIWFIISVFLLGLLSSLLITDWPIILLREMLRNPLSINLGLPGVIVNQWLQETQAWIWNGLSLFLLGLLFYELLFNNNERGSFLWKLSLALVLNPLIWIRSDLNSMITMLLPMGLILSQWVRRDRRIGSILLIIFCFVFSIGLFCVGILTKSLLFIKPFPFILYIFPIFLLFINLYWIRWWMVKNISTQI